MSLNDSISQGILRLKHRREAVEAVEEDMAIERGRFEKLARDESKTRAVSAFNLFQTPELIADRMVRLAGDMQPDHRILEPSAGLGRIYRAIRKETVDSRVVLVEINTDLCAELYREIDGDGQCNLIQQDWLQVTPESIGLFDRIIMNPPFKMGRDITHIKHTVKFLAPGGVLISLCFDGARQNKVLPDIADTWEKLDPGSFSAEGTRAGVCLMTITNGVDDEQS